MRICRIYNILLHVGSDLSEHLYESVAPAALPGSLVLSGKLRYHAQTNLHRGEDVKKLLIVPILVLVGVVIWYSQQGRVAKSVLTLQGNVDIRQVELAFNASGRIDKMQVSEGVHVKAGQLLATLDTERQRLSLAQLEAQSAAQQATLARLQAGLRPEEIREALAVKNAAAASLADARALYERQRALVERHFVSHQQADSARFAQDKARAQLEAANAAWKLAQAGFRHEDIAAAKANLSASLAMEAVMRRDISEGELHALSDGVIENRILEPGDMASPQKPVYTLALVKPVWVRIYLPEKELGHVPVGAQAFVHTDSEPDKPVRAYVGYVSPVAEFTPQSVETSDIRASLLYQARVFVCDTVDGLRQGMPATVTISLNQAKGGTESCQSR